jgi:hypothetical protein
MLGRTQRARDRNRAARLEAFLMDVSSNCPRNMAPNEL